MKIKYDDTHYLCSDTYCCWIETEVITEKKKAYTRRSSGYSRTFEEAVDSYITGKVNTSEAAKLSKLAKEIKELKKEVRSWKEVAR